MRLRAPEMQTRTIKNVPEWLVYAVAAVPALWLISASFTGGLGADPAKALERELGEWALRFLVAGLAITPLWRLTGLNLTKYRRALGLIGFTYVGLHLSAYTVLDYQFAWGLIIEDIWKRPYITIGMAAIKRLGAASWQKLHKLVYVIVPLGALHYVLLTKTWQAEPLIYLAIAMALLALRHPALDFRARPKRRAVQPGGIAPGSVAP
jgi:methionine sulfoxide reductase heme-binding subunit